MFGLESLDASRLGGLATWKDRLLHVLLPVACLSYAGVAAVSRYARSGMLEVLRQDFVRTARAKGLPEWQVVGKHALRCALVPLVTLFGNVLPALLSGSVIVETLFSLPGMGRLTLDSVLGRDYPTVMAISTLVAAATLAGYLLSDVFTMLLDPRVRL